MTATVSARFDLEGAVEFRKLYVAWANELIGPNAGIILPAQRSDLDGEVYCNFDGRFLDVLRKHGVLFEVV